MSDKPSAAERIRDKMLELRRTCADSSATPTVQLAIHLGVLRALEDMAVADAMAAGVDNDTIATILGAVAVGRPQVRFPN
jgi:ADP-ribosylglycohydrolase